MKISTWSLIGYIIGISFSIFSGVRYFIMYPDTDRALVYIAIGIMVCALAWIYNQILKLNNTLSHIEDYLADER